MVRLFWLVCFKIWRDSRAFAIIPDLFTFLSAWAVYLGYFYITISGDRFWVKKFYGGYNYWWYKQLYPKIDFFWWAWWWEWFLYLCMFVGLCSVLRLAVITTWPESKAKGSWYKYKRVLVWRDFF
jgi:hypothetical protein